MNLQYRRVWPADNVRLMRHRTAGTALVFMAMQLSVFPCLGRAAGSSSASYAAGAVALDDEAVRVALLERRVPIGASTSLGAALALVDADGPFEEMQLRLQVNVNANLRGWIFENRNLLSFGSTTEERYRFRLRAISPELFADLKLTIRAFDEWQFDLANLRGIRNSLGAGMGLEIGRLGTVELYKVWSQERIRPDSRYMLAVVTIRLDP